LISWYSCTWCN